VTAIVWFRRDLRVHDHPALVAAAAAGEVVPVFLWDEPDQWPIGAASRWWLHQSLHRLQEDLKAQGSRLIIRRGPATPVLTELARESGATHVYWNRRYEPAAIEADRATKSELRQAGLTVESFAGNLLFEPWTIQNKAGKPFQVFTPFWKTLAQNAIAPAAAAPKLTGPAQWPRSLGIGELELEPKIDWAGGLRANWQPGEAGAHARLRRFLPRTANYLAERDRPEQSATSLLSPHLAFGEITPRQMWHAVGAQPDAEPYRRQLAWREFAHHLLFHFPQTPDEPLRTDFGRFPWKMDANALRAWTKGQTGYPLVDAGMRELWHTGYVHNRVRMVAASFLVKDLLIPWQEGARWFWDTLVDADLANNTLGWQWVAGCGADAAPYFRIFHPVLQGEKFDAEGNYVRHWIPELASLPNQWIHKPWQAPAEVLQAAGVQLGRSYPQPLVDHAEARERALQALATLKQ
jgi:deoxyribodipyrimidine photo-lyase